MAVVWKFVSRPEAAAPVLLDMSNGADWYLSGVGFDISPPPLRRSITQNQLSDGGLVTAAAYDLRELRFNLELRGSTEDDRNDQLKALEAELDKPNNLLMYQPERGTIPVFFRTFKSGFTLDNQLVAGKKWGVSCAVLAEPFAIGERHDIVSGISIQNDPASGTNRTFVDITGVRGDRPSPAVISVGTGFGAGATFMLAVRSVNNPTALTVFAQCEAGTMGTNTTVQANDATMSGAGSNFVRCTFGTNDLITRVSVAVPTASSPEAIRGRYRVLVKCRRTAASSEFLMRFKLPGTTEVLGPQVSWNNALPNTWVVDLGVVDLPSQGPAPVAIGFSGLPAGYATPTIEIQAQRSNGALNLDMDYVYLLPADERQCKLRQVGLTGSNVLDGPNNMAYGLASGSTLFGGTRTVDNGGGLLPLDGGIPYLVPNVTNRLYALRTPHDVTAAGTYSVSYWPLWWEVATS